MKKSNNRNFSEAMFRKPSLWHVHKKSSRTVKVECQNKISIVCGNNNNNNNNNPFHSIPFRLTHRSHKRAWWWLDPTHLHRHAKEPIVYCTIWKLGIKIIILLTYSKKIKHKENHNNSRGIHASTHRFTPFHILSGF